MTIDMSEHIRESNLIENIDDPSEDAQSLTAWNYLITQPKLDHDVICLTQRIITLAQSDLAEWMKGNYRGHKCKVNVIVGQHTPPRWELVQYFMDAWLDAWPNRDAWTNHVVFETVHPFADGNGRTGRMLMWYQQVRNGETPELFEVANRIAYFERLESYRRTLKRTSASS